MLTQLGLNPPRADDLVPPTGWNERGNGESMSLVRFNDRLLDHLGGSWSAPPALSSGWESASSLTGLKTEAFDVFAAAAGEWPFAWKDPRNCVLLPFWTSVIGPPEAAVLVYREPLEVARSLQARDGFSLTHGLALWERYLRTAAANLAGLPTIVVEFAHVLRDPVAWCHDLAGFLAAVGIPMDPERVAGAAGGAEPRLVHQRAGEAAEVGLAEDPEAVAGLFRAMQGSHFPWHQPALGTEPSWVEDVLSLRRELEQARHDPKAAQFPGVSHIVRRARDVGLHISRSQEAAHRKLDAGEPRTTPILEDADTRQPPPGTRAAPFFWVPPRLRQALRGPVQSSLLYLEERRRPPPDYGIPGGFGRVYLYHVRKTGGTSLSRSFLSLGGEDPAAVERRITASVLGTAASGTYVFAGEVRRSLERGRYFFGWSHLPAYSLRLPQDTFTVSVLRDPVQRAISYYNYLVAGDDDTVIHTVKDWERSLAADGFHAFLDRVPRKNLCCQLHMFSPGFSVGEAAERLSRCSIVLASERLDEHGLAALSSRLGLALQPRHERVTPEKAELTAGEHDRLRGLLEPEYQLLAEIGLTTTPSPDGRGASSATAGAGETVEPGDARDKRPAR
jgi:hypothetical protein